MKTHIETPEVLPPEGQISPSGRNLDTLAQTAKKTYEQISGLDQEYRYHALRLGLICMQGKALCKHGEFGAWMATAIPAYGHAQVGRFMSLAAVFLQERKLPEPKVALLCLPDPDNDPKARAVVNQAVEWFGERTLNDVFDQYGIKTRKPKGGARPGAGRPRLTEGDADEDADAKEFWQRHMRDIQVAGLTQKTWTTLPKHMLKKLRDLNRELNGLIGEAL